MSLQEGTIEYTLLVFLWTEYLWELYLGKRQYDKALATTEVPPELKGTMSKETFEKAQAYTLAKSRFGFVKDLISTAISTIVIHNGVLASVWQYAALVAPFKNEVCVSCIWMFLLSTLTTVVDLPLSIYNTFVLEEKFGFNKQTGGFFIWDKIKAFILTQVLTMIISSIIVVTIKNGGDYFFVWLWLVVCIISIVLLIIYPSIIAPIFDKYTPLPEGELRSQIEHLASQLKFPLAQLYVVEGSKRSSHSNAYFYGLFKVKRIVLFDTLLAKDDGSGCNNEEILAVLSHELGHWKYNHVFKNLIIMQVNLFLLFAGFSFMFKYQPVYKAFGFYSEKPVLAGLIIVIQYVMSPYNALSSFLTICLSRRFEFQADLFAVQLKRAKPLGTALIQLNKDNLGFPIYDSLYSAWHHSHPPLLERIAALKPADQYKHD